MDTVIIDLKSILCRNVSLPGGRDKEGRPILFISIPVDCPPLNINETIQYLLNIFSEDTRSRGITIVLDARKGPWKVARSCIKQINSTIKTRELTNLIVLRPDAFWDKQRVENCAASPKNGNVNFIPLSRLSKYVDQSQLPFELGGNFIHNYEQWITNRNKIEEFLKEHEATLRKLDEIEMHLKNCHPSKMYQIPSAQNFSTEKVQMAKILINNIVDKGRQTLQKIEYDNRNRKFASDLDSMSTPQDVMDTISKIEDKLTVIRRKQCEIEDTWKDVEHRFIDTKDVSLLEEGINSVINWILGPAEQLLNSKQKVGYDVASAEELRREHEQIELQCWETYGRYAEIIHKIDKITSTISKNNYNESTRSTEFSSYRSPYKNPNRTMSSSSTAHSTMMNDSSMITNSKTNYMDVYKPAPVPAHAGYITSTPLNSSVAKDSYRTLPSTINMSHQQNCGENDSMIQVKDQYKTLMSQRDFMDFVCRSFANRLERRRKVLITSLRFFRLVSEYFDKTGEVFDTLVMGNKIGDFSKAGEKLKELQENQSLLDAVERELVKEGEKLSDLLSMPLKDALGRDIQSDYSEDIINIRDILDATNARKNIFSDSVELQKITLEQVTHIYQYEEDALQAIQWIDDLFEVMLENHNHVGTTVYEIQSQKEDHAVFQETAKDTYNYGLQLLNASMALRQSCKLPLDEHNLMVDRLRNAWERLLNVSQEQMTRLRVSAVFHRSVEDHCNQLRDLREAVATIPLMDLNTKKAVVKGYFQEREKLIVEVGRMVRLGRLLRNRLREPLYSPETMSDSDQDRIEITEVLSDNADDNSIAIEAISERLSEVTNLAEELDQALQSAQQDCAISTTPTSTVATSMADNNQVENVIEVVINKKEAGKDPEEPAPEDIDQNPEGGRQRKKTDDFKSDDEFLTASECTMHPSRSSSYNSVSECEHLYAPWWEHGKEDINKDIAKEKMVLAVGLPQLPAADSVLKDSPEVPPGKIAREVTETTHFKVQHQTTFGVSSYVLTSEKVQNLNDVSSNKDDLVKVTETRLLPFETESEVKIIPSSQDKIDEDLFVKKIQEVGPKFEEEAWKNFSYGSKQAIKSFL